MELIFGLSNKRLLVFALSLQVLALVSVGLQELGLTIPGLRQITTVLFLSLTPGLGILGAMRLLHRLKLGEILVYSIGLSIAFVMFVGAITNVTGSLLGIASPITLLPLLTAINTTVFALSLLSYYRNRRAEPSVSIEVKLPVIYAASMVALVSLSITGALSLKFYDTNLMLLVLLAIISIIPIVLVWKPSETAYPLFIMAISLSLLFHTSLVSTFLSGAGDATSSFYESNQVLLNGYWNFRVPTPVVSLLSTEIVPPIYSVIAGVDLASFYTMIYPLLYSIMPLVIYLVIRRQGLPGAVAFLSSVLIMFTFSFFTIFQLNVRNGLAELFIALFLLSLFSKDLPSVQIRAMVIIFAVAIIVSHYATGYLFLIALLIALPMLLWYRHYAKLQTPLLISPNFVALFFVFNCAWYLNTSSGSFFNAMVNMPRYVIAELSKLLISTAQLGLGAPLPFSMGMTRNLLFAAALFVGIGLARSMYEFIKKTNQNPEYSILAIAISLIMLSTFSPTGGVWAFARVGHIALLVLAPFCIQGLIEIFRLFARRFLSLSRAADLSFKTFSVLLLALLLFSSGVIAETVTKGGDYSPEKQIHKPRWSSIEDKWFLYEFYRTYYFPQEVASARWLADSMDTSTTVYVDGERHVGTGPLLALLPEKQFRFLDQSFFDEAKAGYVYLRYITVVSKELVGGISSPKGLPAETFDLKQAYNQIETTKSRIYSNGGSDIYR